MRGSVVLDFMRMRFNQSIVVSDALTLLSDAARQDQFGGSKVNPDSIKLVLISTDGSESTTKGRYYKEIVKCLHAFFRKMDFFLLHSVSVIKHLISVRDILLASCFCCCPCCCFCSISTKSCFRNFYG